MPASHTIVYYRNYSAADTALRSYTQSSATFTLKSVDETGWSAPDGYAFKEWNSIADGTGLGRDPGDTVSSYEWYAIWEQDTAYITTGSELAGVADAIRTKGGTSAALTYPAGFVSAIQAIPTGITPTGTISITENGTVDVTSYASASVSVSGGVATRSVTVADGSGNAYATVCYTDANMNPQSASGIVTAAMPVGSIVAAYGMGEPPAVPVSRSGITQIASLGTSRAYTYVFKVDE